MVKAYLRYVQHDVFGALCGNASNLAIVTRDGTSQLVVAANEVINIVNVGTNEIERKIMPGNPEEEDDDDDIYGLVTSLKVFVNEERAFLAAGH